MAEAYHIWQTCCLASVATPWGASSTCIAGRMQHSYVTSCNLVIEKKIILRLVVQIYQLGFFLGGGIALIYLDS